MTVADRVHLYCPFPHRIRPPEVVTLLIERLPSQATYPLYCIAALAPLRKAMLKRMTRSQKEIVRGQPHNLMWELLTIIHRTPSVPVGRELRQSTEPSVGARDTATLTVPAMSTHRVPGCGMFYHDQRHLVPFHPDLIPVHLFDQRTDYPAGPRVPPRRRAARLKRPLPGRVRKLLLQLAPRSRSRGPTSRAPAGPKRSRSPAWEKSSEDDTHDKVIQDEGREAEFCTVPAGEDSSIPTCGATALEVLEPQADLPLKSPPSSVRRRFQEELEIRCRESSASALVLTKPPTMVFQPSVGDGNITESLKERSPLSVILYPCQNFN